MEIEKFVNLEERVKVDEENVDFVAATINDVYKQVDEWLSEDWIEKFGHLNTIQYGLTEEEYDKIYDLILKTVLKFDSLEEFVVSEEDKNIILMLQSAFSTKFYESVLMTQDLEIGVELWYIEKLRHTKNKDKGIKRAMKMGYINIEYIKDLIKHLNEVTECNYNRYIINRDKVKEFAFN